MDELEEFSHVIAHWIEMVEATLIQLGEAIQLLGEALNVEIPKYEPPSPPSPEQKFRYT